MVFTISALTCHSYQIVSAFFSLHQKVLRSFVRHFVSMSWFSSLSMKFSWLRWNAKQFQGVWVAVEFSIIFSIVLNQYDLCRSKTIFCKTCTNKWQTIGTILWIDKIQNIFANGLFLLQCGAHLFCSFLKHLYWALLVYHLQFHGINIKICCNI